MDNKTRTVEYTDIEKMFGKRFGKLVVLPCCFVEDIRDMDGKLYHLKDNIFSNVNVIVVIHIMPIAFSY